MRSTRIALLGCALAVPLPVQAQASAVEIYGRMYPQLAVVRTSGATAPGAEVSTLVAAPTGESIRAHDELQASNSRIGVRGREPLGGDLAAIWQLEQQVDVDQGGGRFASRDSFVGLEGRLGTLKLGNLDTVYKSIGDTLSFLGISSGNFVSDSDVLSKCPLGTSSFCSFHLRRANSVRYDSPAWNGVELELQWSPDEQRSPVRDAWLFSGGLAYTRGAVRASMGYELHRDFFGGSRNAASHLSNVDDPDARSRDHALRGSLRVELGAHQLELDAARLQYRERDGAAGRFESYASNRFAIGVQSRWNRSLRTQVAYVQASAGSCELAGDAACTTSGLDGRQLSVGASYVFSRRVHAYAIAARLRNGASARYSNLGNGAPSTGADTTQGALGLSVGF